MRNKLILKIIFYLKNKLKIKKTIFKKKIKNILDFILEKN